MNIKDRFQNAWNAFMNKDPTNLYSRNGIFSSYRTDRPIRRVGSERSLMTSALNRIALDVSAINILHVRNDEEERYQYTIDSGLNNCLSVEANIDQSGRALIKDIVMSMFDEGCVAVVPVDTTSDPIRGTFDIKTLRAGKITAWYPDRVTINLYNELTGMKQDVILPKRIVGIVENPFYEIMNEPNSTLQRLNRKIRLLDTIDDKTGSDKLNMLIKLPYGIKSELKRKQVETKMADLDTQLQNSKYGIGYIDATDNIIQLNRPLDNTLPTQVDNLTKLFLSQMGITQGILDGTADENTMTNYYTRVVEPILSAITDEFKRKFLSKTARTQHQSIEFFRDPFKIMPISSVADVADKFTRNEVLSSNEVRQIVGRKPSDDPKADELRNKNINQSSAEISNQELLEEY